MNLNKGPLLSDQYIWEECPPIGFTKDDFNKFLLWAVNDVGANDILVESNEPLGIKIDNYSHNVTKRSLSYSEVAQLINSIYQTSAQSELQSGKPFGFPYSFTYGKDERLRFRVDASAGNTTTAVDEGIELVLRPTDGEPDSVDELGLEKRIVDLTNGENGLVLIAGPTGSGKTTLIASLLKYIIQNFRLRVLSIEDPIEFDLKEIPNRLSRVFQSEIGVNVSSFKVFIKHLLRRSPDVVLLGELRDEESIDAGILIAQTGALVFATTHTNDSSSAAERLVDDLPTGVQKAKLSKIFNTLNGIVHQRLLDRLGGGRIAVREELYITAELRVRILNLIARDSESLTAFLADYIEEKGLSIKQSIKTAYKEGKLTALTCIKQLAQNLNDKDITFFVDTTRQLHSDGVINEESMKEWIHLFGVINEEL